jgi:hypothetical protein
MPQLLWRRQTGWAFNNSDVPKSSVKLTKVKKCHC